MELRRDPDRCPALLAGERVVRVEAVPLPAPLTRPAVLPALRRFLGPDDRPVNAAGLPAGVDPARAHGELRLFEALFSRDALIVAETLDPWHPALTRNTVVRLAGLQGRTFHREREEEPGRIPHEVRVPEDPVARRLTAASGWAWPYYGSVDATCLWLSAAVRCATREPALLGTAIRGLDGRERSLAGCAAAGTRWLVGRLEASRHTLLESRPMFDTSIENQVWKDSWDAYSHADGTLAAVGGVASVEVQGLAYDALIAVASLPELDGALSAARLIDLAAQVRRRVLGSCWIQDGSVNGGGFVALGTDQDDAGRPRPLAVLASNMGHLLLSGILDAPETAALRERVVEALFDPSLFCAAGFRTLARRERRFRTTGYHTGSSWPWDSYRIACGLARAGYPRLAALVRERIVRACAAAGCFPEFLAVDDADRLIVTDRVIEVVDAAGRGNRIEQPPQLMQAWTVAAVAAAKRQYARRPPNPATGDHEQRILHALGEPLRR
ncbi:amylo-alpha-1,6-glucosidase [Actinoplanes regularis]|uniref:amylo-alpha-1,6-glucosidase n=1 Tax=Actinoplanes regularis TaxID=52697 RepID=UPI0024A46EF4|nr:hypothetical protein [Actinoplanes regularis]GLW35803.1 hypothetical protein Areg01_87380 [Actinoplanes regularis]